MFVGVLWQLSELLPAPNSGIRAAQGFDNLSLTTRQFHTSGGEAGNCSGSFCGIVHS